MGQLGRILVAAAHSSSQPWWWGSSITAVCLSARAARSCLARSWHKQCAGCETWIAAQNWSEPPCTETAGVAWLQVGAWINGTFLSLFVVFTHIEKCIFSFLPSWPLSGHFGVCTLLSISSCILHSSGALQHLLSLRSLGDGNLHEVIINQLKHSTREKYNCQKRLMTSGN